ncbi:MAG: hypothetical protein Q8P27_01840 [Candidatus Peregrinibacteria bacterium]|nr:hypothetical protein [Candidatus Peregrinibacteria bacterium]
MNPRRLKTSIARLDVTRKWVLLGSMIIALSTFLPWYRDEDIFAAGDQYLGVTGPLFLVGLMVLGSALFVGAWIVLPAMGKRLPRLPIKESALFVFLGLQDLVLLMIANSVFFHPKFGVNIQLKSTGFGMIIAFAGVILMIWSSYRLYKREYRRYAAVEEKHEPLIKMPENEHRPMDRESAIVNRVRTGTTRSVRHEPLEHGSGQGEESQPLRMDL